MKLGAHPLARLAKWPLFLRTSDLLVLTSDSEVTGAYCSAVLFVGTRVPKSGTLMLAKQMPCSLNQSSVLHKEFLKPIHRMGLPP